MAEMLTTDDIRRRYWAMMAREYGVWMLWVLLRFDTTGVASEDNSP